MSESTIKAQLDWAENELCSISCSARLDAEILLAYCLERDRSYLFSWPEHKLEESQQVCFREFITRRLRPEPVAYLVGHREFYSLELDTTPATLVPRPETEMLVDCVLEEVSVKQNARILELGTGTGAIALAVKKYEPHCAVTATDIDPAALEVAVGNARQLDLGIQFIQSDWYSSLAEDADFDVIVSNPPYIAADDPYLSQGDLPAEPRHALCSGPTGLESLEIILSEAGTHLAAGGLLVLEHGWDQGEAVKRLMQHNGFDEVRTEKDYNGLDRMTCGRWVVSGE